MKTSFIRTVFVFVGAFLLLFAAPREGVTQTLSPLTDGSSPSESAAAGELPALPGGISSSPEPRGAGDDRPVEPYATNFYALPYSRAGIGADVSPLGVGIKGALLLNTVFDARLMQNFFTYTTGRFEVDGVNVNAKLRLRSTAAAFDWYPFRSVWRFSIGALFFNGNQISASTRVASGTSVDIDGQTFYSANPNSVTGAGPLTGAGVFGLHHHNPAVTLSGGFGRFIPRSERHWSFPSEFGVAFTGPPTISVNPAGWACLDEQQSQCGNVSDPTDPVGIQVNDAIQARLTKFRKSVSGIEVYPLFSYSVVYSFDIRRLGKDQ